MTILLLLGIYLRTLNYSFLGEPGICDFVIRVIDHAVSDDICLGDCQRWRNRGGRSRSWPLAMCCTGYRENIRKTTRPFNQ